MIPYLKCLCNEIFYFFFDLAKSIHPEGETKEEFVPRGFGLDEHHDILE